MHRYNKKYVDVGDLKVEFYFWGDEITPAIRVSVLKEIKGWFRIKYKKVYSESHSRNNIASYERTAESVVENYNRELDK